jgi:hypothetical protein
MLLTKLIITAAILPSLFEELSVAFDEVGFAGCDPGEVHLDKVLYGAALRHEAPEEGVEPCPQVQDLDSRVAGLKVPTNCRSGKARNKSMDPIPISQFFSKFITILQKIVTQILTRSDRCWFL